MALPHLGGPLIVGTQNRQDAQKLQLDPRRGDAVVVKVSRQAVLWHQGRGQPQAADKHTGRREHRWRAGACTTACGAEPQRNRNLPPPQDGATGIRDSATQRRGFPRADGLAGWATWDCPPRLGGGPRTDDLLQDGHKGRHQVLVRHGVQLGQVEQNVQSGAHNTVAQTRGAKGHEGEAKSKGHCQNEQGRGNGGGGAPTVNVRARPQ